MKKRYILPSVDVIINVRIFMRNKSSLRGKCVNSFFKKIVSLFFEKAERRVKPLMYAQLAILIGVIFFEVIVSNSVDNYWNYSAIRKCFTDVEMRKKVSIFQLSKCTQFLQMDM
ncbi:hypothetical protein A4A36_06755 [Bacillus subtilis]|nr:hypothetical protein A4A35_19515 [Bacillus subtilis]OIS62951.1 hypothetical protein A4A36_06755 [Bacillus subtilis]OIS64650.1 hypothetical protein A4A37_20585 [Bacillus subtilis]TII13584.1 hypothetical protein C6Y43_19195 [Bacillus subtilis]BEV38782.1 hypothetical protein BSB_18550 [Bacillus stercoris]